jgi:hypothetical protein
MLLHICSLLKVRASKGSLRSVFVNGNGMIGLSEQLFEKLASSPAEPHLKALKELFINFNGL